MVAPGRSLVVLALVKLALDLAVDTGNQWSSEAVGHFEQSSIEDLELLLCEGEGDWFHYGTILRTDPFLQTSPDDNPDEEVGSPVILTFPSVTIFPNDVPV